jgi:hypothetical protein
MQVIQAEIVDQIWSRIAGFNEEKAMQLIEQLNDEQPELLAYLMAAPEDFEDNEAEQMLYVGVVLWQIIKNANSNLGHISAELLQDLEDENVAMMDRLSEESEGDSMVLVEEMIQHYPQPHVLVSVSEALISDDEDPEDGVSDNARGFMMLMLKTALDALIRVAA